jgi:hypothetical protein
MGNLVSLHGNDVTRLTTILKFFAKKITVISNFGDHVFDKSNMEECATYIIDNGPYEEFRGIIVETYPDLRRNSNEAKITIANTENDYEEATNSLNLNLEKLKVYGYEKEFKFFVSKKSIMLGFSLVTLDRKVEEADQNQLILMELRDKWVREGRLPYTSGVGAFGIIL